MRFQKIHLVKKKKKKRKAEKNGGSHLAPKFDLFALRCVVAALRYFRLYQDQAWHVNFR